MEKSKKHISGILAGILLAVGVIAAIAVVTFRNAFHDSGEIPYEKNRKKIAALEEADISAAEEALRLLEEEKKEESSAGDIRDIPALRRAFSNAVILGDSFAESIVEYGYLDVDVVLFQRGMSVGQTDEMIEKAVSLNPSEAFFVFGANDLEICEGDSGKFIKAYEEQIDKLKAGLPEVKIYINSILPITEEAVKETPSLGDYPAFNQALEEMCREKGYTYIDTGFLVEDKKDIYEPDGIHVTNSYYPEWLSFLADTAGL